MPAEPVQIAKEYRLSVPMRLGIPVERGGGRLLELVVRVHHRQEDASAYYSEVADYLWRACRWRDYPAWHRRAWEMHGDGATDARIARVVRRRRTSVSRVLAAHRKLMLVGR